MKRTKKSNVKIETMDILQAIGNTPLIAFRNITIGKELKIFGKFEGSNPGGSVKDRAALYMIIKAEESGELDKSKVIVEATSGNMGIALAMIGAAKGYRVKLFMPGWVSRERQSILKALNAEVELTPSEMGTDGAIIEARKYVQSHREECFMPNQFDNPNNVLAHYETTGPEIYRQMQGDIDVFIAGIGTSGTLMGVGKYLKEKIPKILIVGVEPVENHNIQGLKNMKESIVPKIYKPDLLDDKVYVNDDESFQMCRKLAMNEGLFLGMSSGAAVAGAIKFLSKLKKANAVIILPDRGDRYLSTSLFMSV